MITNRIESDLYVTRHLTELRDEELITLPEKFENCLYICALLSALLLLLKNHYDYDLLLLFSINTY